LPKLKAWLSAARLRTLPLSISGILVGTTLADLNGFHDTTVLVLALLTTVGFQITSNFANDYGDGVKGTDNENRIGPKRAYQSGILSRKELKTGISISVILNFLLIVTLLYFSFGIDNLGYILIFTILGIVSIWAAIKYTVGASAYGYRGFGDVFVFCFFGLLSVLGSMFLYTKFLTVMAIFPAVSIGLLSTAVLNLNNLRDYESDRISRKNTMVVKLGLTLGKRYHYAMLFIAFLTMAFFVYFHYRNWQSGLCLLAFIPIFVHLRTVYRIKNPASFDPELRKLALSTFLLAVLFYLGFNFFL